MAKYKVNLKVELLDREVDDSDGVFGEGLADNMIDEFYTEDNLMEYAETSKQKDLAELILDIDPRFNWNDDNYIFITTDTVLSSDQLLDLSEFFSNFLQYYGDERDQTSYLSSNSYVPYDMRDYEGDEGNSNYDENNDYDDYDQEGVYEIIETELVFELIQE